MKEFDQIYLSWRKGQGSRRHIIGLLRQLADGRFVFNYDKAQVEKAAEDGFTTYTEFSDLNKQYNSNVVDVFAQRLIKAERPDVHNFYRFWEIEPEYQDNKFYLLGHTQGLLPTDNFEFLADYKIVEGLHFLTELAGLNNLQLPSSALTIGDVLQFKTEPTNQYDPEAVMVLKDNELIGYIKKVHSKIFYKAGAEKLKLTVKAVDKNGIIKRVFLKVSL